jgi:hypothetical protein
VGVAALVLGIIGLVFAMIPTLGITQLIGVLLGIIALILGAVGRKQASEQGLPTGTATAGLVLGIVSVALGALLYASCMYCAKKVGDGLEHVGSELKKQLGSPEFKKAMERARDEQEKAHRELEKKLEKAIEKPEK